ncbi:hypothetical protein KDA00_03320 [Candidatus Saccharibacteria bacterium]|nr:hypothetical protein [Candidatus Saccharibacteria bacterium]
MIILGMTGPIGHGKTTFADALADLVPSTVHFESSLIVAEVANSLHEKIKIIPDPYDVEALNDWLSVLPNILDRILQQKCNFDKIKLRQHSIEQHPVEYQKLILHVENLVRNPQLAKQKITRENKETYRPFLQWLGGYLVEHVDEGIWYKEIVRRLRKVEAAGTDLCIVGGLRYPTDANLLRDAGGIIIKVYRPGHLQNDMLDPTERERENIKVDCTIVSNGSVEDVKRFAAKFLDDIHSNKLEQLYQTKK